MYSTIYTKYTGFSNDKSRWTECRKLERKIWFFHAKNNDLQQQKTNETILIEHRESLKTQNEPLIIPIEDIFREYSCYSKLTTRSNEELVILYPITSISKALSTALSNIWSKNKMIWN